MNVARSEGQLLTLARALVDGTHPSVISPLLGDSQPLGAAIGPTSMRILQSTLAKGVVLTLVRNSGWRVETRPNDADALVRGRLWERHPTPRLRFTDWSFRLLRMLLTSPLATAAKPVEPPVDPGNGDRILALLVARALVALDLDQGLAAVQHEPLVQLAFPWRVASVPVDWGAFLAGRSWMIEGLQDLLAEAWVDAEREMMVTRNPSRVTKGAARQAAVLEGYLTAIDSIGRSDLADFLLTAGETLVPDPQLPPTLGPQELDTTTPLRDRVEAARASTVFLQALLRIQQFNARDKTVRFFDDDYEATQQRLARWEKFSDARASAVRRATEQLL